MPSFIFESKLDTKERSKLPDKMFGLPKDRKYPLTDAEHVRKAIQFFKFAPFIKRNELANNINRRVHELKMEVSVSKDNPFYKYRDKGLVKESALETDVANVEYEDTIKGLMDSMRDIYGISLAKIVHDIHDLKSSDGLIDIERQIQAMIWENDLESKAFRQFYQGTNYCNPYKMINDFMHESYKSALKFFRYNEDVSIYNSQLLYSIVEDLYSHMLVDAQISAHQSFLDHTTTIRNLVRDYKCNVYHITRKNKQLAFELKLMLETGGIHDTSEKDSNAVAVDMSIKRYASALTNSLMDLLRAEDSSSKILVSPVDMRGISDGPTIDMSGYKTTQYLKMVKIELESEIDIIQLRNDIAMGNSSGISERISFGDDVIGYLNDAICVSSVKLYKKSLTINLDSRAVLILSETEKFKELHTGRDVDGNPVYYGISDNVVYLLAGTDNDSGEYYLILLKNSDGVCANLLNLVCSEKDFDHSHKLKAVKIMAIPGFKRSVSNLAALTEGFHIDLAGNMKFKFLPNKTYMDEYAENHSIIHENYKSGNVEGMKANLAFLFALINQIERDVTYSKHKNRHSKEYIEDANKARSFSINDFKTYMKAVLDKDKDFDFAKYYEISDYGKTVLTVDRDELVGIKKLVQAVLLA